MKKSKIFKRAIALFLSLILAIPVTLPQSVQTVKAADETEKVYGSTVGFSYGNEVPENAMFVKLDWLDSAVYSYTPSELYDNLTSMQPIYYVYADEPLSMNDAWTKLKKSGLYDQAENEKAVVFFINPVNGKSYSSADYDQVLKLTKAIQGSRGLDFDYVLPFSATPNKVYIVGEGKGADFVSQYLTNDIFSSMIAANVLIGANEIPEKTNYAIPAYLINCSDKVVSFYKTINGADKEDTVNGMPVYYNSTYVMDSGYTPKRVIVSSKNITELSADLAQEAWDILLRRVWNDQLDHSYFTEGVECGYVADRPIADELNLTVNIVTGEAAEGTGQSRWYEWVPNEVYDTMKNGTGETYPLIVVNHGNGDHEVYEAEANGWVQLAGDERVIVVAMKDIYELGMPPESASTRYGKENGDFIRNVICKKYPVDMSRIYIAGFSIGAFVTADTASANPDLFAAAAPMAYPGDGYMQIFPYEQNGSDASKYDLPVMYMCGRSDGGNTMANPQDSTAAKVMSTQLFYNQVLTFNEMTDQLLDLVDFNYDWYPGENDKKTNRETGEVTGGYDFWDGTAASYITQNLDFTKYPFYGFDVTAIPNTSQDVKTTGEGIVYERNIFYNEENWPMLEFLVMGDMGHNHYNRYAQIIWKDLFSHYSRNPETGVLSYDGVPATKGTSSTGSTTTTTTKKVPAKGKTVTQNGITYKVTKSSAKNGTVSVTSVKNQTKVTIPASIKINGYTFKVTTIAGKAFYKKTKLTTVVIGKNVTKIGANSFRGCTKLKSVTFKGTTAPTIGTNAFKGTASKITVRVPKAIKSSVLKKLKNSLKAAGISKNVSYKKV